MASPFLSKRELARAWQIAKIAGRYGLVPLIRSFGFERILGVRFRQRMERRYQQIPPAVRLRLALVTLGTTFVKLGQVLSSRSDLLPTDYINELSKLQDEVPPLPFEEIEPVFRASFGFSPFEAFACFNPVPIASASIGQAYVAQLQDGDDVVVKIQRPGVQAQVNTDLSLLRRVADYAHKNNRLKRFDFP
jgi:ubiquinone biosynthesis protein